MTNASRETTSPLDLLGVIAVGGALPKALEPMVGRRPPRLTAEDMRTFSPVQRQEVLAYLDRVSLTFEQRARASRAGVTLEGEQATKIREFIAAVVTNPSWLARAMDPPVPALQLQPRLWEFTLGYLLAQRGSEFNRRSYLAGLLQRSALQHGMDYGHLLGMLMRTLAAVAAAPGLQRQMLQLLSELHEALPKAVPAAPANRLQPGSERWKVLALPQLRFVWRSGWADGQPGAGDVVRAWRSSSLPLAGCACCSALFGWETSSAAMSSMRSWLRVRRSGRMSTTGSC